MKRLSFKYIYKMEISVFGRKINLEVLILIGIVYIIFAMNTFFSCVNIHKVAEGVQNMMSDASGNVLANIGALQKELSFVEQKQQKQQKDIAGITAKLSFVEQKQQKQEKEIAGITPELSFVEQKQQKQKKEIAGITPELSFVEQKQQKQQKEIAGITPELSFVEQKQQKQQKEIAGITPKPSEATTSSTPASVNEGFAPASTNNGQSAPYSLKNYTPTNVSAWFPPNLQVQPGKSYSKGVQDILNRLKQPVPLPEGELLMFDNTPFRPECCPSAYSNSTGCACITTGQYNYLIERGGNNVPYSEY
jgi:hypothetical protein